MALTTMLGSAEDAKNMIASLTALANKSPFELPNLLQATQNMIAYGFEAKQIPEIMTTIGNAAAGLGGSPMKIDAITRALGQMRAKGKLSGEEIRQLAEQGVPALEYLSRGFGKPIPEISRLMEKGLLPLNESMGFLLKGMDTDFGGMMEKQATTMTGAMSTIRDTFNSTIATAVKPFYDLISSGMLKVANVMSSPAFMDGAKAVAAGLTVAIDKMKAFGTAVGEIYWFFQKGGLPAALAATETRFGSLRSVGVEKLSGAMSKLQGWIMGVSDAFEPLDKVLEPLGIGIGHVAGALTALGAGNTDAAMRSASLGLAGMKTAAEKAISGLQSLGPVIENVVKKASTWFADNLPQILETVQPVVQAIIQHFFEGGAKLLMVLGDWAMNLVDWIAPVIPKVLSALSAFGQALFGWFLQEAPRFVRELMAWGSKLVTFISDRLPDALAALSGFAQGLFDWLLNEGVPQAAAALGPLALEFVEWIIEIAPKVLDGLGQLVIAIIQFIGRNLPTLAKKLLEWAAALVQWVIDATPKLVGKFGEMMVAISQWFIKTGIPGIIQAGIDMGKGLVQGLFDIIFGTNGEKGLDGKLVDFFTKTLIPGLLGLAGALLSTGIALANNLVKGFANALVDGIEWAINRVVDGINGMVNMINSITGMVGIKLPNIGYVDLPSFDKGAWKIERDMLAIVHKGEMVVPAPVAATVRGERAPEDSMSAAPQGGGSFSVTINTQYLGATEGEARAFARQMYLYLQDEAARRGQSTLVTSRGGV